MKDNTSFVDKSGLIQHKYYIGASLGKDGVLCHRVDFYRENLNFDNFYNETPDFDYVTSRYLPVKGLTKKKIIIAFLCV